jgi:hypothetical protein
VYSGDDRRQKHGAQDQEQDESGQQHGSPIFLRIAVGIGYGTW